MQTPSSLPEPSRPGEARFQIRVYYEDTDAAGVVFYANYLKYFERGRTEWLRQLGINQTELAANQNLMFVVRDVSARYLQPARLDDLLSIHSRITRLGAAVIHFEQSAYRDGQLLAESAVQICSVDSRSFAPVRLPDYLRSLFTKAQN